MNTRLWVAALCWLWLVCSLTSCTAKFEPIELTTLSVRVTQPDSQEVDVKFILASAESQVQEELPDAYLEFLGFSGDCLALPHLQGIINLGFVQVRGTVRRQVLTGFANVDTVKGRMNLYFSDHSPYGVSTTPLILQDSLPIKEIAVLAYENIIEMETTPCDVNLTRAGTYDAWLVECTAPGSGSLGPRLCEFTIDPFTGQIHDVRR